MILPNATKQNIYFLFNIKKESLKQARIERHIPRPAFSSFYFVY
jgi:hypothetical protein